MFEGLIYWLRQMPPTEKRAFYHHPIFNLNFAGMQKIEMKTVKCFVLIAAALVFSSCASMRKTNRCNSCPKWSYEAPAHEDYCSR